MAEVGLHKVSDPMDCSAHKSPADQRQAMKKIMYLACLMAVGLTMAVSAQVPQLLNYQGRLSVNGTNFTGTGRFKFALVNGGGTRSYWNNGSPRLDGGEPYDVVQLSVIKGLYSAQLGDPTISGMGGAIPATVFTNEDVRLRVWFDESGGGFQRLVPDQRIAAVGYALNAAMASLAQTSSVTMAVSPTIDVTGLRLVIGENNSVNGVLSSVTGGRRNFAEGDFAGVGSGELNRALGSYSFVAGGQSNKAAANFSTVAGGLENAASGAGSFVGGGGTDGSTPRRNVASGAAAAITGGVGNEATEQFSSVGGGIYNSATQYGASVAGGGHNKATGEYSHIGGGSENEAKGNQSVVAGGSQNDAAALFATVGGGQNNAASNSHATVAGGAANVASGAGSFVGGGGFDGMSGSPNVASGTAAVVGGGHGNAATNRAASVTGGEFNRAYGVDSSIGGGLGNIAEGHGSVVAGGGTDGDTTYRNTASGGASTVGGGLDNTASGLHATIPGGMHNSAEGRHSFAAGFDAHARHPGSFVWSDESAAWGGNFSSITSNQFAIRAAGGVGINTAWTPEGGVVINDKVFINDKDLLLRAEDYKNGLGWYGTGKAFLSGFEPDGPVLYGNSGGGLGTVSPSKKLALSWDQNAVQAHLPLNVNNGITIAGGVTMNDSLALNHKDLLVRDKDHLMDGLGWYGPLRKFSDEAIDGPVLYGNSGGALGVAGGERKKIALKWDTENVSVPMGLSVSKWAFFDQGITAIGEVRSLGLYVSGGGVDIHGGGEFNVNRENIHFTGNVSMWGALEVFGLKLFVEPHPNDTSKEIAYVALEGPEAATFIRGTATLESGEGIITLPDHFAMVTAPEGVTVQLTPRGEFLQLYVAESSPSRIVVREAQGKSGHFDYLAQGVRKGYENHQPIRNRKQGGQ